MAAYFLKILFLCIVCCYAEPNKTYSLESSSVCPTNFFTPEIPIGKDAASSVLIKDGNYFRQWKDGTALDCKFVVKANFGQSLLVVIQNFKLRRDEVTKECIDYIQFTPVNLHSSAFLNNYFPGKQNWTRRQCGVFSRNFPIESYDNAGEEFSRKFKKGVVTVKLHIDRKQLAENESIELEIVFTSYLDCKYPISSYHQCDDRICVHKSLFVDGLVNCPYPKCGDEPSCSTNQDVVGESDLNARVTVTAVASVFVSFCLFLGCLMICRYCLLLRQWHQPAPVELSSPVEPTAPPPSTPPPAHDKDLPPPYETLFPDR